ncbi:molybdopterin-binding protein [Mycolicibacterium smegmatis]|nr:molybdopterin-binding oxidoreductase [Mycolicibacterium smegmatis]AWT57274.1 oxidoreductase molybdopterin binding domain, putative [Mycolicibacterium smegmatis MKD8]MCC3336017.1 molybdopterin-binding oxidoreductase [Mycolicibacterium smegmatis]MCO4197222.1 molybdopterin-binding oxidoreductase [Mycolicibacterium smegmatis]MCP2621749.1 molybdopterin-binding oxidoreductase [Mycolicibacterium smegmatis]MDF1901544.1 molybdopterin-binding oxidoreductase [Mycolicibacterium smegmatis]
MSPGSAVSHMVRLLVFTGVSMLALLAGTGAAAAEPQVSTDLSVTGDVGAPLTMTREALRALPNRTLDATFTTHDGPQHHTYTGALLSDAITAAHPAGGPNAEHPLLTVAVVATGADGYAATLAWGDIDPSVTPTPALVAWAQDGTDLDAPRLVLPGDLNGSRYVSELRELRVAQLA